MIYIYIFHRPRDRSSVEVVKKKAALLEHIDMEAALWFRIVFKMHMREKDI